MYNLKAIPKLTTALEKLRNSDRKGWDFKMLYWNHAVRKLSEEALSPESVDHLVIAVKNNTKHGVGIYKILDTGTRIFPGEFISLLFYDAPSITLISQGKYKPDSFFKTGELQLNYHLLRGKLSVSLAGAVRSPTFGGNKFSLWHFHECDIDIFRNQPSQGYSCECAVRKMTAATRGHNVRYRFTIPGAYAAFEGKTRQSFIAGYGVLRSDGTLGDFEDQSKVFHPPQGLKSLTQFLSNDRTLNTLQESTIFPQKNKVGPNGDSNLEFSVPPSAIKISALASSSPKSSPDKTTPNKSLADSGIESDKSSSLEKIEGVSLISSKSYGR